MPAVRVRQRAPAEALQKELAACLGGGERENDGNPLQAEHGAPLRLYSAVKLGYKMVKYLTEVSFLPVRTGGYWEDRGYEWFAGV